MTLQALVSAKRKKIIFPCAYDGPADVFLSSPHRSSSLQAPFTTLLFSFHILSLSLTYFTSPYELFLYYISTLSSHFPRILFFSLFLSEYHCFFLSHYFSSFRSFIKKLVAPQLILLCVIAILFSQQFYLTFYTHPLSLTCLCLFLLPFPPPSSFYLSLLLLLLLSTQTAPLSSVLPSDISVRRIMCQERK